MPKKDDVIQEQNAKYSIIVELFCHWAIVPQI